MYSQIESVSLHWMMTTLSHCPTSTVVNTGALGLYRPRSDYAWTESSDVPWFRGYKWDYISIPYYRQIQSDRRQTTYILIYSRQTGRQHTIDHTTDHTLTDTYNYTTTTLQLHIHIHIHIQIQIQIQIHHSKPPHNPTIQLSNNSPSTPHSLLEYLDHTHLLRHLKTRPSAYSSPNPPRLFHVGVGRERVSGREMDR